MTLRIAGVIGAVLSTSLSVLKPTGGRGSIRVLSSWRSELVLSTILALLRRVTLVVVASIWRLLIIASVALLRVLIVRIGHTEKMDVQLNALGGSFARSRAWLVCLSAEGTLECNIRRKAIDSCRRESVYKGVWEVGVF